MQGSTTLWIYQNLTTKNEIMAAGLGAGHARGLTNSTHKNCEQIDSPVAAIVDSTKNQQVGERHLRDLRNMVTNK